MRSSLSQLSQQRKEEAMKTKKWSTKFSDKVILNESSSRKDRNMDNGDNTMYALWARAVIAKKLSLNIKNRVRDKKRSCKKSLLNLHEPTTLDQYQPHWDSQLSCEVCHKPAIYDSIVCDTCNIVVHFSCATVDKILSKGCQQGEHRIKYHQETDDEPEKFELQCAVCEEFTEFESDYYEREMERLVDERVMKKFAKVIVAKLRAYVARKHYLRQKQFSITCQALLRRLFIMKRYSSNKRNRLRILHLDIKHLPKIQAHYVCWTAVDVSKNTQLFRYDRDICHVEKEGFLVPGASSYLSLFLSFIRVEGSHFYIVGQAQLALRDIDPFLPDQLLSLVMSDNIQWIPQETRSERMVVTCKRESKHDVPLKVISQRDRTCVVRYNALSSFTSFGVSAQGPPVDVLRKVPDVFTQNIRKQAVMPERKTRWWIIVAELNILFYQVFGDTKPRYSCPLFECNASIVKESGTRHHAVLSFPDKRKYDFEFDNVVDMKRFVSSIVECRRGMENQSIYFKHGRKFETIFGHE
jgi:hypothetical protein